MPRPHRITRSAATLAFVAIAPAIALCAVPACGGSFTGTPEDSTDAAAADGSLSGIDGDAAINGSGTDADDGDGDLRISDARADGDAADGSSSGNDGSTLVGDAGFDARSDSGAGGAALFGTASTFAVLAGSNISITDATPTTIIGDVGVSPGTAITTLSPGQPSGNTYAGGRVAMQAQTDLTNAYITLASMPCAAKNTDIGDLGGRTLSPGTYCFATSAAISGDLVLDAKNDANASWVFQIGTTLTTATSATVTVINGGSGCNVQWQLGTSATLGTNTKFTGNIVAATSITLVTGSTVFTGRLLARNGFVTLDVNTVSARNCQ